MFRFKTLGMLGILALLAVGLAQAPADSAEVAALKANMEKLSTNTVAGKYYPEVQIPADLNAIRADMLKIANLGRQNPKFREHNKEASDLSGTSVTTTDYEGKTKEEKIFKNRETPPYFEDLVLNDALNDAAQFQAEWQAKKQEVTHFGPEKFNDKPTEASWQRTITFGFDNDKYQLEGEATANGASVAAFPENWMRSDTHYRPWFNIGHDVRQIGLGLAKDANGVWYSVAIAAEGERVQQ